MLENKTKELLRKIEFSDGFTPNILWFYAGAMSLFCILITVLTLIWEAYVDWMEGYGFFRYREGNSSQRAEKIIKFLQSPDSRILRSRRALRFSRAKIRRKLGCCVESSVQFKTERDSMLRNQLLKNCEYNVNCKWFDGSFDAELPSLPT